MDIWLLALLILIPVIVFSAKPRADEYWLIGRLIFAIGIGYAFIFMAADAIHYKENMLMADFYRKFPECTDQPCSNTPHLTLLGNKEFLYYFGWLLSACYVGLWELVWRLLHRRFVQQRKIGSKIRIASNLVIGLFIFVVFIYPACALIAGMISTLLYQ